MCYKVAGMCLAYAGGTMDSRGKKEFLRTAVIAGFFLIVAFVLLNYVIGNAMDPEPPRL